MRTWKAVARYMATRYKHSMRCEIRAGAKGTGRILHRGGDIPLTPNHDVIYRAAEKVAREQGYHVRVEDTWDTYEHRIVVACPESEHCVHITPDEYGRW